MMQPKALFTKITSRHGPLTKRFDLSSDGSLVKTANAQLSCGIYERIEIANLREFACELDKALPTQAFTYGVPYQESGTIVSEKGLEHPTGAISRTRNNFGWAKGPGIVMLDNDCGCPDDRSFDAFLREECSFLEEVDMLTRPSSSSFIQNTETKKLLTGLSNQRSYMLVDDARQIPRIGSVIDTYLWAAGYGRYEISSAGTALRRNIIDTCVWQPERLDFVGGAVCSKPLTQLSFHANFHPSDMPMLLSNQVQSPSKWLVDRAKTLQADTLEAIKPQLQVAREAYLARKISEYKERGLSEESSEHILRQAMDHFMLQGNFLLAMSDGTQVSVAEILANPTKYSGLRCCDPLEPDYRNDKRIAVIVVNSGTAPYVYSHAHGGTRYRLQRPTKSIQIYPGQSAKAADEISNFFAESKLLFDRGDAIVTVSDGGKGRQANSATIQYLAGTECSLVGYDNRSQKLTDRDLSDKTANLILSRAGQGVFPKLSGIITAPTMSADGRLIDTPGYDDLSKLLYVADPSDEPIKIPNRPSQEQIASAVSVLMAPFEDFPMDGTESRSALFAALLTAPVRSGLPTSPCFAFDAPTQGSGKTKLALCIGALATGRVEPLLPPPNDDDETRKKLATEILSAKQVVIFDNIERQLSSPVLAAFLTSPSWSDRILGSNAKVEGENRILVAITGNNLCVVGDLVRRTLTIRIDPKIEASEVWRREFPFDPLDHVINNRQKLVTAALTILQGFVQAGMPKGGVGNLASFEQWDKLIRQCVIWVSDQGYGKFCDPIKRLTESAINDPDHLKLRALLNAWHQNFGEEGMTVKQLIESIDMRPLITEVSADRSGYPDSRVFAGYLRKRLERIIDGLKLIRENGRANTSRWRVVACS